MELVPNLEQPKIANLSALVVELLPLSVAGDGHKFVIVLVLQDLWVTKPGVTSISNIFACILYVKTIFESFRNVV